MKSILFKGLFEQGARYITDIYKDRNEFLSYKELKNYINRLTQAVQPYTKKNNKQLLKKYDINYLNIIEIFCRSKKGC